METNYYLLLISFFIIAIIYSSVGLGGGSSYLALLAQPFFLLLPEVIRPTALFCNVMVVTGGTIIFYREGKISWKESWPFLISSVPLAFVGGLMKLEQRLFFIVLALTLFVGAIFLWLKPPERFDRHTELNSTKKLLLGGSVGFVSGLVSIGGGIFLSPILHLMNWAEAKRISALASVFILLNSVGGLLGQFSRGGIHLEFGFILPLLASVFVGGQIGTRIGVRKLNSIYIKRVTAVLIFIAAIFILKDHI